MQTLLLLLCMILAKSLYGTEIRMSRYFFGITLNLKNSCGKQWLPDWGCFAVNQDFDHKIPQAYLGSCIIVDYTMHNEGLESWRHVMLHFCNICRLRVGVLVWGNTSCNNILICFCVAVKAPSIQVNWLQPSQSIIRGTLKKLMMRGPAKWLRT